MHQTNAVTDFKAHYSQEALRYLITGDVCYKVYNSAAKADWL